MAKQSCLEKKAIENRQTELVRNDYHKASAWDINEETGYIFIEALFRIVDDDIPNMCIHLADAVCMDACKRFGR